jgi:hypothetical protein
MGALAEGVLFALAVALVFFRGQVVDLFAAAKGTIATAVAAVAADPVLSAMALLGVFVLYMGWKTSR